VATAIKKTRGSNLLEKHVEKFGSYEKATDDLNRVAGGKKKYLRASVWHWATAQHKPGRSASAALQQWAGIPIGAWDEPARA
jgi:hypothetical protein